MHRIFSDALQASSCLLLGPFLGPQSVQVINFYSHKLVPDCPTMMHSLTRMLPDDVSVLSMQRVPPDFHARFTAMGKVYQYHLTVAPKVDPFTRWYSGRVQGPVDLSLMRSDWHVCFPFDQSCLPVMTTSSPATRVRMNNGCCVTHARASLHRQNCC